MKNLNTTNQVEPVIIFLHIPKTAGTTLRYIIQNQYQPSSICELYPSENIPSSPQLVAKFHELGEARQEKIKIINSHFGFGFDQFLRVPYTYITFLREPINRVVSLYYYFQRRGKYLNLTLPEFVQTYPGVHNGITNYLSGEMLKVQLADPEDRKRVNSRCSGSMKLELAQQNLQKHFPAIGLTERFDESLILLKRHLGWKNPYYKKSNVSHNRSSIEDVPSETLKLITQYNQFDLQLYAFARDYFAELIRQQGASFTKEVQAFKEANHSSQTHIPFSLNWYYNRVFHRLYKEINISCSKLKIT